MQVELTEAEVTILKQLARERTPTQRPAVKNSFEPALNITKWFEAQFAKCNKMLPLIRMMITTSGTALSTFCKRMKN